MADPGPDRTQTARRLEAVITIIPEGQAIAQGELVAEAGTGCDSGPEHCHIIVQHHDVSIFVYYQLTLIGGPCRNTNAIRAAEALHMGDNVEVFGQYLSIGMSTCDSEDYHIRRITP